MIKGYVQGLSNVDPSDEIPSGGIEITIFVPFPDSVYFHNYTYRGNEIIERGQYIVDKNLSEATLKEINALTLGAIQLSQQGGF